MNFYVIFFLIDLHKIIQVSEVKLKKKNIV